MTDEKLAEIKARVHSHQRSADEASFIMKMDARALLLEVEQQRTYIARLHAHRAAVIADHERYHAELEAENAKLRAGLRDIVGDHQHQWEAVDPQEVWACEVCHEDSQDYAEEVQEAARALLEGAADTDSAT